ncbi:MAG: AzlD domain-containing protein [Chloroflexota bacterium]
METFWLIFGMFAVTFGVRYPPLALVGRFNLPPAVIRALRYVPVAVLTAITVPFVLFRDEGFNATYTNPYFIAGLVAVAVSYWSKNLLLTIVVGMVVFVIYRLVLGV